MEKYGCNRLEEINKRIKELEGCTEKTAMENNELEYLKLTKEEILMQMNALEF